MNIYSFIIAIVVSLSTLAICNVDSYISGDSPMNEMNYWQDNVNWDHLSHTLVKSPAFKNNELAFGGINQFKSSTMDKRGPMLYAGPTSPGIFFSPILVLVQCAIDISTYGSLFGGYAAISFGIDLLSANVGNHRKPIQDDADVLVNKEFFWNRWYERRDDTEFKPRYTSNESDHDGIVTNGNWLVNSYDFHKAVSVGTVDYMDSNFNKTLKLNKYSPAFQMTIIDFYGDQCETRPIWSLYYWETFSCYNLPNHIIQHSYRLITISGSPHVWFTACPAPNCDWDSGFSQKLLVNKTCHYEIPLGLGYFQLEDY